MTPAHTHHGLRLCARPFQSCKIARHVRPVQLHQPPASQRRLPTQAWRAARMLPTPRAPALIAQKLAAKPAAHAPGPATEVKKPAAGVPRPCQARRDWAPPPCLP